MKQRVRLFSKLKSNWFQERLALFGGVAVWAVIVIIYNNVVLNPDSMITAPTLFTALFASVLVTSVFVDALYDLAGWGED